MSALALVAILATSSGAEARPLASMPPGAPTSAPARSPRIARAPCDERVDHALAALDEALKALTAGVDDVESRNVRKQLRHDVETAQAAADALRKETCGARPPPPPTVVLQPPVIREPAPVPVVDDGSLRALSASIE